MDMYKVKSFNSVKYPGMASDDINLDVTGGDRRPRSKEAIELDSYYRMNPVMKSIKYDLLNWYNKVDNTL